MCTGVCVSLALAIPLSGFSKKEEKKNKQNGAERISPSLSPTRALTKKPSGEERSKAVSSEGRVGRPHRRKRDLLAGGACTYSPHHGRRGCGTGYPLPLKRLLSKGTNL